MSTSATPEPIIRQIVEAMRALAGPHPGFRPVHAKGLVCSGTFRASADASRVTRAAHFTGQSVPTIIRFANANGNPDVHDGVRPMCGRWRSSFSSPTARVPTSSPILSKDSSRGRPRSSSSSCGRSSPTPPVVGPTRMRFLAFLPAIPPDAPSSSA